MLQIYASLAQSGERHPVTVEARGSKPLRGAIIGELGELAETTFLLRRHMEQKLCIEGSNPSLSARANSSLLLYDYSMFVSFNGCYRN